MLLWLTKDVRSDHYVLLQPIDEGDGKLVVNCFLLSNQDEPETFQAHACDRLLNKRPLLRSLLEVIMYTALVLVCSNA